MTWSTYFPKSTHNAQRTTHNAQRTTHNAQRTTHISHNSAQKLFISSARQGVFCAHTNFRCKNFPNFFRSFSIPALFLVFALASCDPPKSSSPKPCTRADRFTLAKKVDNTYTLTICEGVQTIAEGEFSAEASIGSGATKKDFDSKLTGKLGGTPTNAVTTIVLPSTLQTIGDYAFYNHTNVTGTFTVPKQVNSIGENSFHSLGKNSSSLAITFTEPSQLTSIGKEAFRSARTSVLKLPQSLETIENGAFLNLEGVRAATTFTIPANVKKIGDLGFANTISQSIKGTLTIDSPHLIRTPKDMTQFRTGNLGSNLFIATFITPASNFTTIKLLKEVYESYTTADLNAIFGTGATYQDLDGNPHTAKTS